MVAVNRHPPFPPGTHICLQRACGLGILRAVIGNMTALLCVLALLPGGGPALGAGISGTQQQGGALKARRTSTRVPARQQAVSFSSFVVKACAQMPRGGGYAANTDTIRHLSANAVHWDAAAQRLHVEPAAAQPSFCSSACYVALLRALELWQQHIRRHLPPEAWQALDITEQKDGIGVWGRANANGPGFAKLVHDLQAGRNFEDVRLARPGDFLKFFWTEEIGCRERGHQVVYLGTEMKDGKPCIRYWSSNSPDGYGVKSTPAADMHHMIFTRITRPEMFARAARLPETDEWLSDMQRKPFTYDEIRTACGIIPRAD